VALRTPNPLPIPALPERGGRGVGKVSAYIEYVNEIHRRLECYLREGRATILGSRMLVKGPALSISLTYYAIPGGDVVEEYFEWNYEHGVKRDFKILPRNGDTVREIVRATLFRYGLVRGLELIRERLPWMIYHYGNTIRKTIKEIIDFVPLLPP